MNWYKMSEFLEKNKNMIQIVAIISCIGAVILYLVKYRSLMNARLVSIEQRLVQMETIYNSTPQHIYTKPQQPIRKKSPPPVPATTYVHVPVPAPAPLEVIQEEEVIEEDEYDDDDEVETPQVQIEQMDEEINSELNRLKLIKEE